MSQVIVNSLLIKGMLLGLRKNNGCKLFYFLNKIRSHQITTVSMAIVWPVELIEGHLLFCLIIRMISLSCVIEFRFYVFSS